ncbi:MAG: hypothetical protein IKQ03_05195 [Prevotella sp.]|nr:hypothetical protein [Prevotella sp.]
MIYNDKIQKTEEQMLEVIDSINSLDKDRFIASLYIRNCSPLDIEIRLAETRRCLAFVHKESLTLAKVELTYNWDFAVLNNKYFSTAEMLFNRLRSSMAYLRKTIRKSCPRSNKKSFNPNFRPSMFERAVLTKGCCARDLYDITSFDDNVQALYYEQQALFANVILSLSICYRVLKQEKEVKGDAEQCIKRLIDQCQRIVESMKDILDFSNDIPKPHIQLLIDEMGMQEFAKQNYHETSIKDLKEYAIYRVLQENKEQQPMQRTLSVFKNEQRGEDALLLLKNFDKILPSNRKKMDALKIRLFCNWCDGGKVDNPKQKFYQILLKNYQGQHIGFPDWHAINTSKSRKGLVIMDEQKKFNEEAAKLLKQIKQNRIDVA